MMSTPGEIAEQYLKAIREAAALHGQTVEDYLAGGEDAPRDPASAPCYLSEVEEHHTAKDDADHTDV